MMTMMIMINMT